MSEPFDNQQTHVFRAPSREGPPKDLLRSEDDEQDGAATLPRVHGGAATLVAVRLPTVVSTPAPFPPPSYPAVKVTERAAPTAAPTPAAPARPVQPVATQSPLFRHEALRSYSQGQGIAAPLDVAPLATRLLFFTLLVIAIAALVLASLGHVELTSLGRGVLRAPEGVQPVTAAVAGVVSEVLVEPGQSVEPGQLLLRIDSTQIRAELLDAERKLAALLERQATEVAEGERLYRMSLRKLHKRRALMERRVRSQQRGMGRLQQRNERVRALNDEGLEGQGAVEEAGQAYDDAERAWLSLQDQLALVDVDMSRLEREREAARAQRAEERERATSARDAVRVLLEQTQVQAQRHGKLEGLRVSAGQQVQPGMMLARLTPDGSPREVTAFMPERDRAFLTTGRAVRLELDRLPVGEFGSIAAHVTRISSDVASTEEVVQHLGTELHEAVFRVDLRLDDAEENAALAGYLQSGSAVTVRAPLRSRRIVSLMFDPIRRILD